jgi:phosphatidate cytidylyltransferase
MKRVLTALLLAPFIVGVVMIGPSPLFLAVTTIVALLCFREFSRISDLHGFPISTLWGMLIGAALVALPLFDVTLIALPVFAAMGWNLRGDSRLVLPRTAALAFGLLYCFVPWRCAVSLRHLSPWWLVFALSITWVGDAAAYFVGRAIGRHKLWPSVSPGKSWEGSIASVGGAALYGFVLLHYSIPTVDATEAILLSAAANIAGQMGDLCESGLKRGANIKDSGQLLPGHGGMLDRVDSSLFSLPLVYVWLSRSTIL